MDVLAFLKDLPQAVLSGLIVAVVVLLLFVPIALRVAGLSGQQIVDLLMATMRFFINFLQAIRAQNKDISDKGQEETD